MTNQNQMRRQEIPSAVSLGPFLPENGSSVFITGATGLLGTQLVKALCCCGRDIRIIALARSMEKARAAFCGLPDSKIVEVILGDVTDKLTVSGRIDYIIHGASPTDSRFFVEKPVETVFTALSGTRNVLELARKKGVKKVVYLSSLEVYGVPDGSRTLISETDYGYIDPMQVRSSYSEGKRMAECICVSYAREYGVPVCVARLSQTFGPGVSYNDSRVFAEFARCAIEGRDIVLRTRGTTVRSYCCTSDAIRALLTLMIKGEPGEAYNVTNMDNVISIREMAELVCSLVPEKGIRVRVEIPENVAAFGYNPEMVIRLDSRKLQALGWQPAVELPEMFLRLIESMKSGVMK